MNPPSSDRAGPPTLAAATSDTKEADHQRPNAYHYVCIPSLRREPSSITIPNRLRFRLCVGVSASHYADGTSGRLCGYVHTYIRTQVHTSREKVTTSHPPPNASFPAHALISRPTKSIAHPTGPTLLKRRRTQTQGLLSRPSVPTPTHHIHTYMLPSKNRTSQST